MTTVTSVPAIFTSNAKDFVDYISGKTSKDQFLNTKGWKSLVEECGNNDWLANWAGSHIDGAPDNTDHIEPEYIVQALRNIRNSFRLEGINFAVDPDLASVLADKDFIEALENDKKHICYMRDCIGDLLSNCSAAIHFINMGWFDEPFDNRRIETLLELFEKSVDLATNMIIEEKTGACFRSRLHKHDGDCAGLFYPLEKNSDSWDEWVHLFPNTIKFFLGEKFNLEKHLEDKHNFSTVTKQFKQHRS